MKRTNTRRLSDLVMGRQGSSSASHDFNEVVSGGVAGAPRHKTCSKHKAFPPCKVHCTFCCF